MRLWIVNPYGTLPSEGWRAYRSAMIAAAARAAGHEVHWFLSDIEHRSKTRRMCDIPPLDDGTQVHVIPARMYQRNISLGRIRYERSFGHGVVAKAATLEPPDLIILGEPALFFEGPVSRFAAQCGARVVSDVLDLWPEMFTLALPRRLRGLGRVIFGPLYRRRARTLAQRDGVVAVSRDYLTTTASHVTAPKTVAYLGVDLEDFAKDRATYHNADVAAFLAPADLAVVYAGTLGNAYGFDTVLTAMEHLSRTAPGIRFVVAGSGPLEPDLKAVADQLDTVMFIGQVPASHLPDIYGQCDVGLATYAPGSEVSMPVKFYDYLAAGLCVVTSLDREIRDHVTTSGCGSIVAAGKPKALERALLDLQAKPVDLAAHKTAAQNLAPIFDCQAQHRDLLTWLETDILMKGCPR